MKASVQNHRSVFAIFTLVALAGCGGSTTSQNQSGSPVSTITNEVGSQTETCGAPMDSDSVSILSDLSAVLVGSLSEEPDEAAVGRFNVSFNFDVDDVLYSQNPEIYGYKDTRVRLSAWSDGQELANSYIYQHDWKDTTHLVGLIPAAEKDVVGMVAIELGQLDSFRIGRSDCDDARQIAFREFADSSGRDADSSLLVELLRSSEERATCVLSTPPDTLCSSELVDLFDAVVFGTSGQPIVDQSTLWHATPPSSRNLDLRFLPRSIAESLVLVPVALKYQSDVPGGTFRFRCELGASWAWATSAIVSVAPVVGCRGSSLKLEFTDDLSGTTTSALVVDDPEVYEQDGLALAISYVEKRIKIEAKPLRSGALERLLELSSEQIEDLRSQYSQPMAE